MAAGRTAALFVATEGRASSCVSSRVTADDDGVWTMLSAVGRAPPARLQAQVVFAAAPDTLLIVMGPSCPPERLQSARGSTLPPALSATLLPQGVCPVLRWHPRGALAAAPRPGRIYAARRSSGTQQVDGRLERITKKQLQRWFAALRSGDDGRGGDNSETGRDGDNSETGSRGNNPGQGGYRRAACSFLGPLLVTHAPGSVTITKAEASSGGRTDPRDLPFVAVDTPSKLLAGNGAVDEDDDDADVDDVVDDELDSEVEHETTTHESEKEDGDRSGGDEEEDGDEEEEEEEDNDGDEDDSDDSDGTEAALLQEDEDDDVMMSEDEDADDEADEDADDEADEDEL